MTTAQSGEGDAALPRSNSKRSFWQNLVDDEGPGKLVLWIPLVFMVVFFLIPLALTLVWSVFERTMFWMEPGFTFAAYGDFFNSGRIDSFLNSIKSAAITVAIAFCLGFPIAVFVRRSLPVHAQHQAILLFILPFMISEVIRLFALRPVLGRNGILNDALMSLGLVDEPLSVFLFTPTGVVIGEVLSFLPFMVFCGFLAMEAVPGYVFELCDDIGSGLVSTMRRVIIPLAAPGIFAASIFIFVNSLGLFLVPDLLGGPGAANAGTLVVNAIAALDFPLAMAIAAIMVAMMVVLLWIGHRMFDLTKLLEPFK
ncbi:MAG: ABC transporter permease [Alphaproteobacteria bacterium]|nr:ABC transporter permease [Alphaproteobacteria bacterium]